ncbi:TetR/AcrR family transcriptional regulator [Compostimonas suwonensis]|uniref:Regulatory TetR family protein n=1 Tax=Compostimonas suwonensis TaxID=1048394 RepID=A0A2M9C3J8_9MICO|nr:TetR/AcrR family transcriptional regulator [Compostimonas suwonensis]PJJ65082.1 regulatory TetR family protein [Compostimonas suwonensis]
MAENATSARPALTRGRACAAGVALADVEGIDAVSMRNLAARLEVSPMALYKHVRDKEDLLGGMIDIVIASYDTPRPGVDWKQGVRARILSARRALLQHPWARRVIEASTTRTPTVLAYMDSLAGMFMAGGLSVDLTHHAMHALGHRIWGFSPEAFDDPDALAVPDDPAEQEAMLRHVSETYPHILAIALGNTDASGAPGSGCDEQSEFEFTLDLLLDAFDRLHAAGWSSRQTVLRS